jgi:acetyl esterase/lipase
MPGATFISSPTWLSRAPIPVRRRIRELDHHEVSMRSLRFVAPCLLALFLLPSSVVHAQVTPTHPGLVYATVGGTPLHLDLYLPAVGSGPFPTVVWIHGGGWSGGTYTTVPADAPALLARGIAVASVEYRLTSQAGQFGSEPVTFPAQIEDVKGAVRWLRAHASTYGLDPARMGSHGASAGAHLSALLATSGGASAIEGTVGGNPGFSSAVQAAADVFGPTALLYMDLDVTTPPGSTIVHDDPSSPESHLIGFDGPGEGIGVLRANISNPSAPFPFFASLVTQADPIHWVDTNDPPMFIAHGTADSTVPMNQSRRLADALRAAGVPVTFHAHIGGVHGNVGGNGTVQAIADFFAQEFFGPLAPQTTCSADGTAIACPCGNSGYAGHGCANSQALSIGAVLAAGGSTAPDSLTLHVLGMPPVASCVIFQGSASVATPAFLNDGVRCAGGTVLRLATKFAQAGSAQFPAAGDPTIPARAAAMGSPIPSGASRVYQVYYRDTVLGFCPPPNGGAANLSNGVVVTWP